MNKVIILLPVFALLLGLSSERAFAACKPIYGGGVTQEQVCDGKKVTVSSPTPTKPKAKDTATPTPKKSQTTTKGGLTVVSPTPQKKTPSTGPEMFGLIALAPAAAVGWYLKKRS